MFMKHISCAEPETFLSNLQYEIEAISDSNLEKVSFLPTLFI